MQDAEGDLGHHMLGRDDVDVVHAAGVLQFQVPLGERLARQLYAVAPVGDVEVLAEDAAQVAPAHDDGAAAIVSLDAGLCRDR